MNPGRLSLTTDFDGRLTDPREQIVRIGKAGFEFTHWCHEWDSTYIYSDAEISSFADTFKKTGVQLLDTHASEGSEKDGAYWLSRNDSIRQAGIKLIINRLEMTAKLGGNAAVLHVPDDADPRFDWLTFFDTMDDLLPVIRATGIPIAFENLYRDGNSPENLLTIEQILSHFPPDEVGMCLDTGHFNMESYGYKATSPLWNMKDRIIALHLHDNPGRHPHDPAQTKDSHMMPYSGSVDWAGFAEFLSQSSYATKPLSFESSLKEHGVQGMSGENFLTELRTRGYALAGEINARIISNTHNS